MKDYRKAWRHHPVLAPIIAQRRGAVRAIADCLGVSPGTIYGWHRIPAQYIKPIAELFQLDPIALLPEREAHGKAKRR